MFLQMNKILFRWAPLPGWIRSWPRSREREVGWRGRGPSSLRGRQGRQQEDDHNVEDHVGEENDDDVVLIAQRPDWPRSGRLFASPRCKERSRWRLQPARSSSERRLWNLCVTKYDSCHNPLKHANIVGNMVYLKDCGDYHSSHLFLNNNNENYFLIMCRFEGINHNFTKKLYEWENRWRRFDINLT